MRGNETGGRKGERGEGEKKERKAIPVFKGLSREKKKKSLAGPACPTEGEHVWREIPKEASGNPEEEVHLQEQYRIFFSSVILRPTQRHLLTEKINSGGDSLKSRKMLKAKTVFFDMEKLWLTDREGKEGDSQ